MNRLRLLTLAATALLLAAFAGPAAAQSITSEDQVAIQARVDQLDSMMSAGDLAGAIELAPPRLMQAVAARAGIPVEQLLTMMRERLSIMLEGVSVVSFEMDLAAAPPLATPDGSRTYLLIPTEVVLQVEGARRMRSTGHSLALQDEGQWYLIQVEQAPQAALVRELWPEFTGVDFPAGTMAAVD